MKNVLHFKSPQERLAYLKGDLEEIVPKEAKREKAKSEPKKKTTKKKGTKKDEVQAE